MCSLTIECVLLLLRMHIDATVQQLPGLPEREIDCQELELPDLAHPVDSEVHKLFYIMFFFM